MTTTPILDGLTNNGTQKDPVDTELPTRSRRSYDNVNTVGLESVPKQDQDFMADLVDAQQVLINAHHRFLHDSNIGALAAAQHGFIQSQAEVLERLRVFG